jgi:hypothetical protein
MPGAAVTILAIPGDLRGNRAAELSRRANHHLKDRYLIEHRPDIRLGRLRPGQGADWRVVIVVIDVAGGEEFVTDAEVTLAEQSRRK